MSAVQRVQKRARRVWQGAQRMWKKSGSLISYLLFFSAMFFGLSWLVFAPVQGVEPAQRAAVTQHEGRDVAIVAYDRMGPRGMFQLLTGGFESTRVAALDIETGDLMWDVAIDDVYDSRIVGAGQEYAYVATNEGLWVLSLDGGATVAKPGEIAGFDSAMAEAWAYDMDAERGLIVAIDEAGELWSIPLDTVAAEPANDGTVAEWEPILAESFRWAEDPDATADETFTRDGAVVSVDDGLERFVPDQGREPFSDLVFTEPEIIVDSMSHEVRTRLGEVYTYDAQAYTAVGDGYIVVAEEDWYAEEYALTTVDLDSGKVISSLELNQEVQGGTTGASGASVVVGDDTIFQFSWINDVGATVVLISPDGTMREAHIGRTGFFGEAL